MVRTRALRAVKSEESIGRRRDFEIPYAYFVKFQVNGSGFRDGIYNLVGHFVGFHLQYQRINVSHITLTITLHL